MPEIYIKVKDVADVVSKEQKIAGKIMAICSKTGTIRRQMRNDAASIEVIGGKLDKLMRVFESENAAMLQMSQALEDVKNKYEQTERGIVNNASKISVGTVAGAASVVGETEKSPFSVVNDWFGYEFADSGVGVSAYIGKSSGKYEGDYGSAGYNAYLGKFDANADFEFFDFDDIENFNLLHLAAGVSASAFSADANAEIGNDIFGGQVGVEGKALSADLGGQAGVYIENGKLTAIAEGEAMVSAVTGKANGSINILGVEIGGYVEGHAGAAGVEGHAGIEDGKIKFGGGIAAVVGGSFGIEIGFTDFKKNAMDFVDFITFWD
jgi:hypothetical protein